MKFFPSFRYAALAAMALFSTGAFAAGTTAGTSIDNKATLSFSVGGVAQTAIESSPTGNTTPGTGQGAATTFVVDRRINLTVATTNTAAIPVALGNPRMVTSFNVTNSTNDVIDVILSTNAAMPNNSTGPVASSVDNADFVNGACTTHLTLADAQAGSNAVTRVTSLAADGSQAVFVSCNIQPLSALTPQTYADWQGKINVVSLIGQAAIAAGGAAYTQDTGADVATTVQNVFGDQAGGNGGVAGANGSTNGGAGNATDTYRDGKHSANSAYVIQMPILSVLKSEQLICDPLNGATNPKHIPGALVRYTITVSNAVAAQSSAILTSMADTLPSTLALDANYVNGTSAATCVAGGTPVTGGTAGSGLQQTNGILTGGTQVRPTGAFFRTNAADTDGASAAGQVVSIDYAQSLPAITGTHAAGELKPGESVTYSFQAFIN